MQNFLTLRRQTPLGFFRFGHLFLPGQPIDLKFIMKLRLHIYPSFQCDAVRVKWLAMLSLLLIIFGSVTPADAARVASVRDVAVDSIRQAALTRLLTSPAIDKKNFTILVTDLQSGEELVAYEPERPLVPASIMKSLTVATLLDKHDPDWKYQTKVYVDAPVREGVLDGNIVIVGSGDPTINSPHEPRTPDFIAEIRDALRKKGVDSVAGRIIIDESLWAGPSCPPSWGTGNMSAYYGTGSHPFNFENNASGKSAIQNISPRFVTRLGNALRQAGIPVGGNQLEEGRRRHLLTHQSAPLEEIMRSCMMRSDNLFAECFLRTYSVAAGGDGSTASGAEIETDFWKKRNAPMENVRLEDGSGLSRSNRLTARFLSFVLGEMADNVEYASFFPLAGQEGTLRNFMKNSKLDSYLAMKTGSMTGIQCYAGYLLDDDFAPTHSIVVMVNNLKGDRSRLRADLGSFFLSLFQDMIP